MGLIKLSYSVRCYILSKHVSLFGSYLSYHLYVAVPAFNKTLSQV